MKKILMICLLAITSIAYADENKYLDDATRVVITKSEREAFKKLKTDAERQAFIKELWAKRDPSPGTEQNEFKAEIENRIKQVDAAMKGKKSVENDLGMTLLLLGPPDEHKIEENKGSGVGSEEEEEEEAAPSQKQTLTFKKLPSEIASGEIKIEYHSGPNGWEFEDEKAANELLEKARQRDIKMAQTRTSQASQQPQQGKPPTSAPPVPPKEAPLMNPALKTALDAVAAGNAPKDVPIAATADVFMTSDGKPFATVAISSKDAASGNVGIRIIDSSGKAVKETEVPFSNPQETAGYFQTGFDLAPGQYTVVLGVAAGDKTGGAKQTLTVPDSSKLSLSSVILSKKYTQLPDPKPEKEPYTFGKIKLDPNIDRTFTKQDELMVFFEVYQFQPSAENKANLEVVYTFQKENDTPKSTNPAPLEGLVTGKKVTAPTGFPLKAFPPGKYTLTVKVTDKASNQVATHETNFVVQ